MTDDTADYYAMTALVNPSSLMEALGAAFTSNGKVDTHRIAIAMRDADTLREACRLIADADITYDIDMRSIRDASRAYYEKRQKKIGQAGELLRRSVTAQYGGKRS